MCQTRPNGEREYESSRPRKARFNGLLSSLASRRSMASYSFSSPGYVNIPPYYNTAPNGYSSLNFQYPLTERKNVPISFVSSRRLSSVWARRCSVVGQSDGHITVQRSTGRNALQRRSRTPTIDGVFAEPRRLVLLPSVSTDVELPMLPVACLPVGVQSQCIRSVVVVD